MTARRATGRGVGWFLAGLACMPTENLEQHRAGVEEALPALRTSEAAPAAAEPAEGGGAGASDRAECVACDGEGSAEPTLVQDDGFAMGAAQDAGIVAATPAPFDGGVVDEGAPSPTLVTGDDQGVSEGTATESPNPAPPTPPVTESGGTEPAPAGAAGAGSVPPPAPPAPPPLRVLPDDLIDAPVTGEIIYSDEAEWEVDGVFQPTFEVRTPSASYWVVKPLGTMVSMEDAARGGDQWIAFSSGFRPLRGVPAFPSPPTSPVTTVRDEETQTPTHVRLTSETQDRAWRWVWDIYITHATLTVERAPVAFGFGYRGVPGGSLGTEDRLVLPDGTGQSARNSFSGDLPGPFEWAYLTDTTLGRSLYLIQHLDDAVADRYQVRDNDSAMLLLGNSQLTVLPQRFSIGIIRSATHAAVQARAEYVHRVMR